METVLAAVVLSSIIGAVERLLAERRYADERAHLVHLIAAKTPAEVARLDDPAKAAAKLGRPPRIVPEGL